MYKRQEGKVPLFWSYGDGKYIRAVQKKFGSKKIKSFPNYTMRHLIYYSFIRRIKQARLLYYVPYDKSKVKEVLKLELGWQDYGGHHYESCLLYTSSMFKHCQTDDLIIAQGLSERLVNIPSSVRL